MKTKTDKKNKCDHKRIIFKPYLENQDGIALATGVIILLMLIVFSAVAVNMSTPDIKRTKDYTKTRTAFYLAEAGIQRAVSFFNYDSSGDSPGEVDNGFDDEIDGSNWPTGTFSSIALGSGTFTVTIADNNDGDSDTTSDADKSVFLTSVGTFGTTTSTIEAHIHRPLYKSKAAISTEDDLTINGNPTVTGTAGIVHTNGDMTGTSNNVSVAQTASGSCSSPCISGSASVSLPTINPADFKSYADFWLNSDGTITDVNGVFNSGTQWSFAEGSCSCPLDSWNHVTTGNAENRGWHAGGGGSSRHMYNGMYYSDLNIHISTTDDYSDNSAPWQATILAEGDINVEAGADMINYKNGSHTEDIQNLFMVTAEDIDFQGNFSQTVDGVFAAKEQIELSGDADINGFVIASNEASVSGVVNANAIGGGMSINYDANITAPFLSNVVTILTWQET
ncbi:MAG: hypothetical protein F3740_01345 [Nitrospinae bacterium]|nr:hypothetical protein [Nitrospinota bacterium]